jgi:large subunit ribosomal protein L23
MTAVFDIIRRPIITEKSNFQNSVLQQYVFEVAPSATKSMVKDAVEEIFDVSVLQVNVINVPAKKSRNLRTRQRTTRRKAYKKAIVTLSPGDSISVFEGVM